MSTATPLDCIGVGINTAPYGHRVSFLRPDRAPAAKPLIMLENRAGGLSSTVSPARRSTSATHTKRA